MTLAEQMSIGLQTTGVGLLVVFVALALIIAIISIFSLALKERRKEAPVKNKKKEIPDAAAATAGRPAVEDDGELIAVLMAAVAAQQGCEAGAGGLKIRSYRRVENKNAWAEAGKNAQIFNKF